MIASVIAALSGKRYTYNAEIRLHAGLPAPLDDRDIAYERELHVTGGRIDFVVGSVGVEVKIKGSVDALRRQIERYSEDDRFAEFLVVTTKPIHRAVNGVTANGKRVRVLTIGGLSL